MKYGDLTSEWATTIVAYRMPSWGTCLKIPDGNILFVYFWTTYLWTHGPLIIKMLKPKDNMANSTCDMKSMFQLFKCVPILALGRPTTSGDMWENIWCGKRRNVHDGGQWERSRSSSVEMSYRLMMMSQFFKPKWLLHGRIKQNDSNHRAGSHWYQLWNNFVLFNIWFFII